MKIARMLFIYHNKIVSYIIDVTIRVLNFYSYFYRVRRDKEKSRFYQFVKMCLLVLASFSHFTEK